MSLGKLALASGLTTVALAGCGVSAKPIAGTLHLNSARGNHALVDNPVKSHLQCLLAAGVHAHRFTSPGNRPSIQVGMPPTGPTVIFDPTPGGAQYDQMNGSVSGAEVIGSALLYPNQGTDALLSTVENCLTKGVKG